MQVDRPLADLIPVPECVVAKDEVVATVAEFGIVLTACPSFGAGRARKIIVADN